MRISGFEIPYDDARWYARSGGGLKMLWCKPNVCPSVQVIMFWPDSSFAKKFYAELAEASKTKNGVADFVQKRMFNKATEVQSASAAVRGETATVTLHFIYKEGSYRYSAYGRFFMNGDRMHAVFGASRSPGASKALHAQGMAMLKRR